MVRQFATQFNISVRMDSFDNQQKKKGKDSAKLSDKIQQALARMDLLLKENFELKREIVFERKKFIDLQNSFNEFKINVAKSENVEVASPNKSMNSSAYVGGGMRPSAQSSNSNTRDTFNHMGYWQLEKTQMQQTIIALGEEVEYLSVRNQQLIDDMKRKDPFYETYVKTTEELTKLRQAHAILISMIKSKQVNIAEESKLKGVDKYELNVPLANNKYRGGNPISH